MKAQSLLCVRAVGLVLTLMLTIFCSFSEARIFRVCLYDGYPLIYQDETGKPGGLFVDILEEIASKEQWSLHYRYDTWENCLGALKQSEVDLLGAIAETDERDLYLRFSKETILVNWGVLFTPSGHTIQNISELQGKRIAALQSDVYVRPLVDLLNRFGITVEMFFTRSYDDVMRMVKDHKADLGLVNRVYALFAQSRYRLSSTPIVVHPVELKFAASLETPPFLLDTIDQHVHQWKQQQNSFLDQALSRWLQMTPHGSRDGAYRRYFYAALGGAALLILVVLFLRKQLSHKTRDIQDVTNRLTDVMAQHDAAKTALAERENWYQALFQQAEDGLLILSNDGTILEANPAACRLFHLPSDRLLGRTPMDFSPAIQSNGEPSQTAGLAFIDAVLAGCPQRFLWTHQTSDGRIFDAEVQLSLLFQEGEARILACFRDVSQQRALQAERKRHWEYLKTVLDGIPLALFVIDLEGRVVLWNLMCETLTKLSKEEVLGKVVNLRRILQGRDLPIPALLLLEMGPKQIVEKHPHWRAQVLPFHSEGIQLVGDIVVDGQKRHMSIVAARLRNNRGELLGVIQCARDITVEVQMQKQLLHSQKMEAVGRLAGGIAHDFNNILTIILGYCDLLQKKPDLDPMVKKGVDEIEKTAERASNLTRQLLAFSRKQIMQPIALDLNNLIEDLAKILQRAVGEDIRMEHRFDREIWPVLADAVYLEQILLNLVINARDAMPLGGRIVITTRKVPLPQGRDTGLFTIRPGDYVGLRVEDTGHGMDPEVQQHVFEPFFSTKPEGRGTGLGLATVYGIVKQLGGYILVESEVGKGTAFDILLPRAFAEPARVSAKSQDTREDGRGHETIVVVEDEEALREMVREILSGSGYRVIVAAHAREALAKLERLPEVDLVVTDVVMPEMNGIALSREIAQRFPHLPVLYISGYTDDQLAHRGILLPEVHFLAKPFTGEALLKAVRKALNKGTRAATQERPAG